MNQTLVKVTRGTQGEVEVVSVVEPTTFEQAVEICKEVAQKEVDYLRGEDFTEDELEEVGIFVRVVEGFCATVVLHEEYSEAYYVVSEDVPATLTLYRYAVKEIDLSDQELFHLLMDLDDEEIERIEDTYDFWEF